MIEAVDGRARGARGREGELAAERFLVGLGMVLVARDVRLKTGQLDLVMMDGECLVLVEVKARSGRGWGLAQEAVGWQKLRKLAQLAETFRLQHPGLGSRERVDVVAVDLDHDGRAIRCEHIPNVIS